MKGETIGSVTLNPLSVSVSVSVCEKKPVSVLITDTDTVFCLPYKNPIAVFRLNKK